MFATRAGLLLLMVCGMRPAWPETRPRPFTVAHRGGMARQPQNTLAAFRHAVAEGIDYLEFDMVVTRDNQIVIHHDLEVREPLCEAPSGAQRPPFGPIRLLPLAEVRRFDCGSWKNPRYPEQATVPGARMPTLDEVLAEFADKPVRFLAETKMARDGDANFVDPAAFVELILKSLARHPVYERFLLQSGDYRTIGAMRRREPRVPACLLNARRFQPHYLEVARQHHAGYLMLAPADTSAEQIRELHAAGVRVISNTVGDAAGWERCLDMGMDGLMSDDPDALARFVRQLGTR